MSQIHSVAVRAQPHALQNESGGLRVKLLIARKPIQSPRLRGSRFFLEQALLIHIITLRFSTAMDGFDDTPLTDFIKDKSVVSLRDHFFIRNETPYLVVVVVYEAVAELVPKKKTGTSARQRDATWRALLQDADMPLFEALRSWRAERCKQDGIPPYVICNNKQLAKIAGSRPQTLEPTQK